jgi:hypothetical protein
MTGIAPIECVLEGSILIKVVSMGCNIIVHAPVKAAPIRPVVIVSTW